MADIEGIVSGEYGLTHTVRLQSKQGVASDLTSTFNYNGEKIIYFRSPRNRRIITSTCAFTNTGSDGQLDFAFTSDSSPDVEGEWICQAELNDSPQTATARSWPFTMLVLQAINVLP